MRPTRLELEGFTAFRERTVVDFDDAELFALTGPTGSGKSSLIDAMTFALYGSVPRYDDRKLVYPVISQGLNEARVRFDFAVGGRAHTAVRVVRRPRSRQGVLRKKALTKEARLERGADVLAGSAEELTAAVERLIGLSFDQFTKCVVLPQGEFAAFLHADSSQRQKLLVRLLGLDLYARMGQAARLRQAAARQRLELCEEQLGGLAGVDARAVERARKRVERFDALLTRVERARPELDRLAGAVRTHTEEAAARAGEAERLAALELPAGLVDLTERETAARLAAIEAKKATDAADAAREKAERALGALPEPEPVAAALRAHEERAQLATEAKQARAEAKEVRATAAAAARALKQADAALATARDGLAAVQRDHAAHSLAATLEPGSPCPVCLRPVPSVPEREVPPELADARERVGAAERAHRDAERTHRERERARVQADSRVEQLDVRLAAVEERLADAPGKAEAEKSLRAVRAAQQKLDETRRKVDAARARERAADAAVAELAGQVRGAWDTYDQVRDALAALEPPAADRDDLAGSWRALCGWAEQTAPRREDSAAKARRAAEEAEARRAKKLETLAAAAARLDVTFADADPRDAVVGARADARAECGRLEQALADAEALRERAERARTEERVAGVVARHLRADQFERWLLDEAFARLVDGASRVLEELSQAQYALAYDRASGFEVVDHRNADERRSVKTLSGGETFLASLALALTLVDQVAELAAHGSARLESIFLDEGFGSLDVETLDTVATTIEELATRGRSVGLVTHVRDLAERVPVQYRVERGPSGSTVRKVTP